MKIKKLFCFAICLVIVFSLIACSNGKKEDKNHDFTSKETTTSSKENSNGNENTDKKTDKKDDETMTENTGKIPVATITMENGKTITVELDPKNAPITTENFVKLANEGFYDGLTFHRIVPGFVIQGGDPEGTGYGGSSQTIKGEFLENGVANNLKHTKGVISMARSMHPDSASSQFFIVLETSYGVSASLDGKYAAFGVVTDGLDVVDEIAAVQTDEYDAPIQKVVMKSVKISYKN